MVDLRQVHHGVGNPGQRRTVVRSDQDRSPRSGAIDQHTQDCRGGLCIKLGRRLVADQHVRIKSERAGHHGPLKLPIGDLMRIAVQERRIQLGQLGKFGEALGMMPRARTQRTIAEVQRSTDQGI